MTVNIKFMKHESIFRMTEKQNKKAGNQRKNRIVVTKNLKCMVILFVLLTYVRC